MSELPGVKGAKPEEIKIVSKSRAVFTEGKLNLD
jgi:hypothetical protein